MLTSNGQCAVLVDDREGVRFMMNREGRIVSVLVSRHALDDIDPPAGCEGPVERFREYRKQFEEIAGDKFDRGLVEEDGTVCVRARDLPGHGAH